MEQGSAGPVVIDRTVRLKASSLILPSFCQRTIYPISARHGLTRLEGKQLQKAYHRDGTTSIYENGEDFRLVSENDCFTYFGPRGITSPVAPDT